MDATPPPRDLEDPADKWFVHRHTLDPSAGPVLTGPATELFLTPVAAGGFRADFELASGCDSILLHRNVIGVESYWGSGRRHHARMVYVEDRARGLQLLVGHVTAHRKPWFGVRDLFVASRDRRTVRPMIGAPTFVAPMRLPLDDNLRPETAGAIKLTPIAGDALRFKLSLADEPPQEYEIEFKPLTTGGLEFRYQVREGHSIGGLVLPSAREGQHPLLLCFRHRHDEGVHSTVPEGGHDPVGDVPGHPACTTVYVGNDPA